MKKLIAVVVSISIAIVVFAATVAYAGIGLSAEGEAFSGQLMWKYGMIFGEQPYHTLKIRNSDETVIKAVDIEGDGVVDTVEFYGIPVERKYRRHIYELSDKILAEVSNHGNDSNPEVIESLIDEYRKAISSR